MSQPPLSDQVNSVHRAGDSLSGASWNHIREALRGLRFGSVNIIVQDGVIVQIDRLEKRRIRNDADNR